MSRSETFIAGRNLMTTHGAECYPGLRVVRPGPLWSIGLIVPEDGQTVVARGGERIHGYETMGGACAQAFQLEGGDRATLVRSDLEASLVEWRVERARAIGTEHPPSR
jgi:hypothetical protein